MSGQNLTKLGVHGVVDKICVGTINRLFSKTATELRLLVDLIIRFLFNFYRMNGQNRTKFCIHTTFDKIYVGVVGREFSPLCNRGMALD